MGLDTNTEYVHPKYFWLDLFDLLWLRSQILKADATVEGTPASEQNKKCNLLLLRMYTNLLRLSPPHTLPGGGGARAYFEKKNRGFEKHKFCLKKKSVLFTQALNLTKIFKLKNFLIKFNCIQNQVWGQHKFSPPTHLIFLREGNTRISNSN